MTTPSRPWLRTSRALISTLVAWTILSVAGGDATAQVRQSPLPPGPPPGPAQAPMGVANICSTQWGWCPLQGGAVVATGAPCACYDPRSGRPLPGFARAFNYTQYPGPVSPYLNPHWSP